MEKLKKISLILLVCAFAGTALPAQTLLLTTTLSSATGSTASSALTTGNLSAIAVVSATGISAPTANTGNIAGPATSNASTYLYVDRELMQVVSVSGTAITVIRGVAGTSAASHASGALVFVVPAVANFGGSSLPPQGSATRTNEAYLPHIQFSTGIVSDVLGGQWVNGDDTQTTRAGFFKLLSPQIGAVTYAAAMGTSTATTAAELYCTEIDVPYNKLLTGLAPHVGATGGTDKWIAALYDSGGNPLAWSALAGTTAGTTQTWQQLAFTTTYFAVGPAQYYGCIMSNGTTATLDLITTGKSDFVLTFKSGSAGTFGTLPTFTAPTGFTTLNGAYLYAY